MSKVTLKENQTTKQHGVYFANLEAYNSGRMVGGWLYPLDYDCYADFEKAIKKVTRFADEIAIHDYDDFPDMGEYPDHEKLYDLIHALDNSHLDNEVILQYYNDYYSNDLEDLEENIQDIENNFITIRDNFKEYADELAELDIENLVNKEARQFVYNNFDYDGYARDLEHSYNVIDLPSYEVAIFHQS
jgi:antirestriction protein